MKKILLILCALLLTAIGASAQEHECVADLSHWSLATTAETFQVNTGWSGTLSDGTEPNWIEYWTYNNNASATLTNNTISHTQLADLPNGYYAVSVFARACKEASSTAITSSTTFFNANEATVDITTGSLTGTYDGVAEAAGTYNLLAQVTEGTLDISFTLTNVNYNWFVFKNLVVTYIGTTATLEVVTGDMNSTVQATMEAAVGDWNEALESGDLDMDLFAAAEAAIQAAEASKEQYAEIAALVEALDDDGKAAWATTETYEKYTAKTLESSEDFGPDMAKAQEAQTTADTDWSCVLRYLGDWTGNTGIISADGSTVQEHYQDTQVSGTTDSPTKIIYKTISGVPSGKYKISFYAEANVANIGGTAESNSTQIYANDAVEYITVGAYSKLGGGDSHSWLDTDLYTLECTVTDGTLEFGMQNVATGGNWFTIMAESLTLEELIEITYEDGEEVHSCEAEFDHWTISGNNGGSFQRNTWSSESDPSGLVTPFIEYWVGSGNVLSAATIDHYQIANLPAGYYTVSIFARLFDEGKEDEIVSNDIFFVANSSNVDLTSGTHTTYDGGAEVYGTYHLLATVTEDGTLDIGFTIAANSNCDWLAFKNLTIEYTGTSLPTLEGIADDVKMNSALKTEINTAVATYNDNKTEDGYIAALNLLDQADASIAYYAVITEVIENLDKAGLAAWEATESATAYNNGTLTDEDVSEDLAAAQKAQTTAGTDWSYVLKNTGTWMKDDECEGVNFGACGSYPTAHEAWRGSDFTASETHPRKPIYKMIENLPAGKYELSFYSYAAQGTTTSENAIMAFANESSTTVAYDSNSTGPNWNNEGELYTLTCNVNVEGTIRFGMESTGKGAWYVMEEGSLTLVSLATEEATDTDSEYKEGDTATVDGTIYSIKSDNMVENHSFELGFEGWTNSSDYATEITSEYFELRSGSDNDAQDGKVYLVGATNNGATNVGSLGTAWAIETGKTYYMSYYVKGLTGATDGGYLKTSLTNSLGTESEEVGTPTVTSEWQKIEYVFDSGSYSYVQVEFRWLDSQWAFDNFQIYEVEEATEEIIDWEMTDAGWGTLILPFDVDDEDVLSGLTLYAGSALELSSDGTTLTVGDASETIAANTPYLVSGSEKTYEFTGVATNTQDSYQVGMLVGTLVDLSQDAGLSSDGTEYVLQNHEDDGEGLAFYPITSESTGVTLSANHCYLTTTANVSALHLPGMATAIEAVESETLANGAIYDLSGRRVSKAVKGVYIQNGKKVLVK